MDRETVDEERLSTRPMWMPMSFHDKGCVCRFPHNVRTCQHGTVSVFTGLSRQQPTVYEQCFVSPRIDPTDRLTLEQKSTHNTKGKTPNKIPRKKQLSKEEFKYWSNQLAKKPVSVKKPFLISNQHWISRGHTQQWPWKAGMERRKWMSTDEYSISPDL